MKTTVLTIEGMHCDGCAATVETVLGRTPGVHRAEVSFATGEARILHDADTAREDVLAEAVVRAGFRARPAPQ